MKTLFTIILLAITVSAFTQKNDIAENFTLQDTDGNIYTLFDELDAGKTVLLYFFDINCGSCGEHVSEINAMWQHYGGNGETVWVWGIETWEEYSSSVVAEWGEEHGALFPLFSIGHAPENVPGLYGVSWTPQLHIVCPNRTTTIIESNEYINFQDFVEECQSQINELYSNNHFLSKSHNGYKVNNYIKETITAEVFDINGRLISTQNILVGESENIRLPQKHTLYLLRLRNRHTIYLQSKLFMQ